MQKSYRFTIVIMAIVIAALATGCEKEIASPKASEKPKVTATKKPTVKVSVKPTSTKKPTVATSPTPTKKPTTEQSIPVVSNHTSIEVMVNKSRALPSTYTPSDLVEPNVRFSFSGKSDKKLLRQSAAAALESLFKQAESEGVILFGVSGYRSYSTQKAIFTNNVNTQGYEQARRYSAYPGTSEHQTGLSIDVSSASANYALEEKFGATVEGKWLQSHCADFGFIIRYPNGKEAITGYAYEPWHIRYVGSEMAKAIMSQNLTLEEYFGDAAAATIKQ